MDGSFALWALLERKYALPVVLHADDSPAVLKPLRVQKTHFERATAAERAHNK